MKRIFNILCNSKISGLKDFVIGKICKNKIEEITSELEKEKNEILLCLDKEKIKNKNLLRMEIERARSEELLSFKKEDRMLEKLALEDKAYSYALHMTKHYKNTSNERYKASLDYHSWYYLKYHNTECQKIIKFQEQIHQHRESQIYDEMTNEQLDDYLLLTERRGILAMIEADVRSKAENGIASGF